MARLSRSDSLRSSRSKRSTLRRFRSLGLMPSPSRRTTTKRTSRPPPPQAAASARKAHANVAVDGLEDVLHRVFSEPRYNPAGVEVPDDLKTGHAGEVVVEDRSQRLQAVGGAQPGLRRAGEGDAVELAALQQRLGSSERRSDGEAEVEHPLHIPLQDGGRRVEP